MCVFFQVSPWHKKTQLPMDFLWASYGLPMVFLMEASTAWEEYAYAAWEASIAAWEESAALGRIAGDGAGEMAAAAWTLEQHVFVCSFRLASKVPTLHESSTNDNMHCTASYNI